MRLIIAGSRDMYLSPGELDAAVELMSSLDGTGNRLREVVSGGADGMDSAGEAFAKYFGCHVTRFPADWDTLGKAAGPIRNQKMADYADALLIVWDGESPGSRDMFERAEKKGMPICSIVLKKGRAP